MITKEQIEQELILYFSDYDFINADSLFWCLDTTEYATEGKISFVFPLLAYLHEATIPNFKWFIHKKLETFHSKFPVVIAYELYLTVSWDSEYSIKSSFQYIIKGIKSSLITKLDVIHQLGKYVADNIIPDRRLEVDYRFLDSYKEYAPIEFYVVFDTGEDPFSLQVYKELLISYLTNFHAQFAETISYTISNRIEIYSCDEEELVLYLTYDITDITANS